MGALVRGRPRADELQAKVEELEGKLSFSTRELSLAKKSLINFI